MFAATDLSDIIMNAFFCRPSVLTASTQSYYGALTNTYEDVHYILSTVDVDICDLIGYYVIYQLDSYDIRKKAN